MAPNLLTDEIWASGLTKKIQLFAAKIQENNKASSMQKEDDRIIKYKMLFNFYHCVNHQNLCRLSGNVDRPPNARTTACEAMLLLF